MVRVTHKYRTCQICSYLNFCLHVVLFTKPSLPVKVKVWRRSISCVSVCVCVCFGGKTTLITRQKGYQRRFFCAGLLPVFTPHPGTLHSPRWLPSSQVAKPQLLQPRRVFLREKGLVSSDF